MLDDQAFQVWHRPSFQGRPLYIILP